MEFKCQAVHVHFAREREPELLPEDDEPRDDFDPEPDDLEDPPDLDPEADFFEDAAPERPFEDLLELLREDPLLEDEEREPPLLDDAEDPLRFDVEPEDLLPDERLDPPLLEPEDDPDEPLRFFAPEDEPDELLRFEPEDELLLPPDDLLAVDFDDRLLDDDREPPFPPLELLREVEDPLDRELRDPPAPAVSAIVDWTTFAAPSTAPIAAPAISVPAASAALASKPPFFRLLPLRDELDEPDDRLDEVLFFPFVVAIIFPLPVCNAQRMNKRN